MQVFFIGVTYSFTYCHTIGAYSKTDDDKILDKQGYNKLLAVLKR